MPGPSVFIQRDSELKIARQLSQYGAVTSTAAFSLYSPAANTQATVKRIFIVNDSGADATYRLFHDEDGTTYDASTLIKGDTTITAGASHVFDDEIYMNDENGNLAIKWDKTATIAMTLYGEEIVFVR